jgi:hypothetical protein
MDAFSQLHGKRLRLEEQEVQRRIDNLANAIKREIENDKLSLIRRAPISEPSWNVRISFGSMPWCRLSGRSLKIGVRRASLMRSSKSLSRPGGSGFCGASRSYRPTRLSVSLVGSRQSGDSEKAIKVADRPHGAVLRSAGDRAGLRHGDQSALSYRLFAWRMI